MKKIMFNDKYGLTAAVLQGRKTITRRIISNDWLVCHDDKGNVKIEYKKLNGSGYFLAYVGKDDDFPEVLEPSYQIGEVVAVAQRYSDIAEDKFFVNAIAADELTVNAMKYEHGWNNKQGVKACYMPHHIRITGIKIERLQDISIEDCLKEGIKEVRHPFCENAANVYICQGLEGFYTRPRDCFADLIDKVSGQCTWERNPWVFVYSFEKID